MACSAVIHFIFVEMRVALVFYLSMQKMIIDIAGDLTTTNKNVTSFPVEYQGKVGLIQKCSQTGLNQVIWSMNKTFHSDNGCVVFDKPWNYFGQFNMGCVTASSLFFLAGLYLYKKHCTSGDFQSGAYLNFTWEVENYTLYKFVAKLLQLYVIVGFGIMAYVFGVNSIGGYSAWSFVQKFWMTAIGLLFTALSFTREPIILFNHTSPQFLTIMAKRSTMQMLTQTNVAWAELLQTAMLQDLRSDKGDLVHIKKMIPDITPEQIFGLFSTDDGEASSIQRMLLKTQDPGWMPSLSGYFNLSGGDDEPKK